MSASTTSVKKLADATASDVLTVMGRRLRNPLFFASYSLATDRAYQVTEQIDDGMAGQLDMLIIRIHNIP